MTFFPKFYFDEVRRIVGSLRVLPWLDQKRIEIEERAKNALSLDVSEYADARIVRRMQVSQLRRLTPWLMMANIANSIIALYSVKDTAMFWTVAIWCTVVLLMASWTLIAWYSTANRAAKKYASERSIMRATKHAAIIGGIWCVLPLIVLPNCGPEDQLLVACIVAGMSAGGAFALSPIPTAALTFLATLLIPTLVGIAAGLIPAPIELSLVGLVYFVTLSATILARFREFSTRINDRFEIEHQRETISLLLNDFEATASDWLWEVDTDVRLKYASEKMLRQNGRDNRSVLGSSLVSILGVDSKCPEWLDLVSQLEKRQPVRDVVIFADRGEENRWWSITARPISGSDGVLIGFRGVTCDVSELVLARKELEKQNKKLESFNLKLEQDILTRTKEAEEAAQAADKANEAKSIFLAKMSHEIRSPMNGIFGMTDLLLQTTLTDRQMRFVSTISGSTKSLLTIVNDILDLSRAEAGHLAIDEQEFDLYHCAEGAIELFGETASLKDIDLTLFIDDSVPSVVWGDKDRLRQIFVNLIGNAVKFTQEGVVSMRIDVSMVEEGNAKLAFSIEDTGIGIDQNTVGKLCAPFTQADSSINRRFGGAGLGLSISKHLVELMGGELKITSQKGSGTTISFEVSVRVGDPTHAKSKKIMQFPHGTRVLIVDDREVNCEILSNYLSPCACKVVSVNNAQEAILALNEAVAVKQPFSTVITDVVMPGIDGIQLLQIISSNPDLTDLKTILLTSMSWPGDIKEVRRLGGTALLTKPIRQSELIATVAETLGIETSDTSIASRGSNIEPRFSGSILVADDNPVNVEVARELLTGFECSVTSVENGQDAISKFEAEKFDLIMMDCQMPEIDGLAATRRIRELEENLALNRTPIIAVTAHAYTEDKERCMAAGMDGYLSKPYTLAQLADVLRDWLTEKDHLGHTEFAIDSKSKPKTKLSKLGTNDLVLNATGSVDTSPIVSEHWMEPNDVQSLVANFGEDIARKLLSTFLDTLDEFAVELEHLACEQDDTQMGKVLHKLIGGAETVSVNKLANIAREIQTGKQSDIEFCTDEVKGLRLAVLASSKHIKSLLETGRIRAKDDKSGSHTVDQMDRAVSGNHS